MVRNKYYVVRKLADVIYALPVGQGIVRDYPVMQLGALEYDIVRKIDQDENPRKVFDELAISNIIQNYVVNEKLNSRTKMRRIKRFR